MSDRDRDRDRERRSHAAQQTNIETQVKSHWKVAKKDENVKAAFGWYDLHVCNVSLASVIFMFF